MGLCRNANWVYWVETHFSTNFILTNWVECGIIIRIERSVSIMEKKEKGKGKEIKSRLFNIMQYVKHKETGKELLNEKE